MSEVDPFLASLAEFIRHKRLLRAGQKVLVAVSGGVDSMALAAALRELDSGRLHLAHVNHGLRADADADAEFVAQIAHGWGVPCHVEKIDVPALAQASGLGIEEACRQARYYALIAIARAQGISAVAVAHHRDDQVETILHRFFRGTHLRGLCGMQAKRELASGLWLIRPLLGATRQQIEQFCLQREIPWRIDSTNEQTDFTRNFIRLKLLPMLRERINPKVDEAAIRLSAACAEAEATLEALAEELLERARRKSSAGQLVLRIAPLRKAQPLLASLALRLALERLGAPQKELSQERFGDLLDVLGGKSLAVDLPGGVRASSDGKKMEITFAPIRSQDAHLPAPGERMENESSRKGGIDSHRHAPVDFRSDE